MLYSFNQRLDCIGVDEPFYAYWLKKYGIDHPGREETLNALHTESSLVYQQLEKIDTDVLFVKNMAKHMNGLPLSPMHNWIHLFIIRHPAHIIYSMEKVIDDLHPDDVGHDIQYQYYNYFKNVGAECIVMDITEILADPESTLKQLCRQLAIDWDENMLSWPGGPKTIDGPWAKYWYKNVHQTTGWIQRPARDIPDVRHKDVLAFNLPYYHLLKSAAIK